MNTYEVIVYLLSEIDGVSQQRIAITTDHDLTLGDEKACEIVEDKCEELGLTENWEDYSGHVDVMEVDGFDIVDGDKTIKIDIVRTGGNQ
tara:strand:+ start:1393 stop:1662 length:270 start_codon:yes stop_codon:yes gene_type:complete